MLRTHVRSYIVDAEELSEHCNYLPYYGLCVVVKEPSEPRSSKVFTPEEFAPVKSLG